MNCEHCSKELETYRECEQRLCDRCFSIDYNKFLMRQHNEDVLKWRESKRLTRHQQRYISMLKNNPDWQLRHVWNLNKKDRYEIVEPATYEYQDYVEHYMKAVHSMTEHTYYELRSHLYMVRSEDGDDWLTQSFAYEEKTDDKQ